MVKPSPYRIGVVIVNYNSGGLLALCLRSLANSHAPLDVVVVDNRSKDGSQDGIDSILSAPHQFKLIRNNKNVGFSKAVNQGVLTIRNKFIVLLNPDCTVFPHTFLNLQKVMAANKNIAAAGPVIFNQDGSEQRGCRRNEPTLKRSAITALGLGKKYEGIDQTWQPYPRQPQSIDAVSGALMMVRRSYFDEFGGMDEDYFLHCEDLDICRQFRDMGYEVVFCPNAGAFHSQGGSSGVSSLQVEKYKHDGMQIYNNKYFQGAALEKFLSVLLIKSHYIYLNVRNIGCKIMNWTKSYRRKDKEQSQTAVSDRIEFNALDIVHNTRPVVIVTGAKSDVGDFLLEQLSTSGYQCFAVSRSHPPENTLAHIQWLQFEFFQKCAAEDLGLVHAWINLAPAWTNRPLGKVFHKFKPSKIISLSSTSIEGKYESDNEKEIQTVNKLIEGERWLTHYAKQYDCDCTIFRPTLVYGGPRNQNVNFLKTVIKGIRVFPLLGEGEGKRQPIHAEDIAAACIRSLDKPIHPNCSTYNLAGGEILSYRKMLDRIFITQKLKPRYIKIPGTLIKFGISLLRLIPVLNFVNYKMVERSEQDLIYSTEQAVKEIGFKARKFIP